jgi:fatty acid synthase subunit beta
MTYDTMDKDGQVKLSHSSVISHPKYTFSHPTGFLFATHFATQFAQITLVMMEKAAFKDMCYKGFIQNDCAFTGHSLGEYSTLASLKPKNSVSQTSRTPSCPLPCLQLAED